MAQQMGGTAIPAHIPADMVVDFDLYNLPLTNAKDPQAAFMAFRDSGDILWTPRHGGHWVVTSPEDIRTIQNDTLKFNRSQQSIPNFDMGGRSLPMMSDPPEHEFLRRPLTRAFLPQVIAQTEDSVRGITVQLIETFADRGECDFAEEFGKVFPILVFLDLVELPRADRLKLLPMAEALTRGASVEEREIAWNQILDYLTPIVTARREKPGNDLISLMVNTDIDGERICFRDALTMSGTVTLAGLDTVAAMLGFVIRHLAMNPMDREQIVQHLDDERFMKLVVEEFLRRYPIANSGRVASHDMDWRGAPIRKGDMVLVANVFVGLDETRFPHALAVDFSRSNARRHSSFDSGPHTCVGASLARRELRIFLEEWLRRIPEFSIKPGTTPMMATGMVSSVLALQLQWPVKG